MLDDTNSIFPEVMDQKKLNKALNYIESQKWDKAIEILRLLSRKHPKDYDVCQLLGASYLSAGKFEEAIRYFKQAIRLNPNHAAVHANYSQALENVGRLRPALKAANKAVELAPENPHYLYGAASLCQRLGHLHQALATMQSLVAIEPAPRNLVKLGEVHRLLGDTAAAIRSVDQAFAIDPFYLDAVLEIGRAHV